MRLPPWRDSRSQGALRGINKRGGEDTAVLYCRVPPPR
jgi:hypothetical protein